ncbi:uncharacterized protein PHALS_12868 [Plasmopara halstedii]|uniref:Uncharacterized protein n=1 Tax=Plasmopara halstedii TaxID=4781 RepID=A0A0P1AN52_PLAHL|nr:uncharacterized protein PHALS_12868 [Plasmopara halstedii]CEG42606.1 hypothetical protein PHALS_12868 [Plasmopara halstedii]|eukprot:XP_024578975.1 hypothetical protein PHALS_12868 [Plasmopara halstedii]
MAAVSMHNAGDGFGGMDRRLSLAFHTLASPLRHRHFDLAKLRELAQSDEFSDSESDGVTDDEEEVHFMPYTTFIRTSPKRKTSGIQQRPLVKQRKKSDEKSSSGTDAGCSPKGDDWEIVDKSPTFESVAGGKTELGGESWFVQDRVL